MNILKRKMEEASTPEDAAGVQAVAALSQAPQDVAQADYFSTDPVSGYDAAQIALRLFEGRFLSDFTDFVTEQKLSPNIVLANGLTLLQNSLTQFPDDVARVKCLLELGANPNLFMRRTEEKTFGKASYRLGLHPLNYAFANYPQQTTREICLALRTHGANADGIKHYMETDPDLAVPDDAEKAAFRKSLVSISPDPACIKAIRRDVDLSVMQRELVDLQAQLKAAGFEVVSYAPPQKVKAEPVLTTDAVGKLIADKGIYLGLYEPKDRDNMRIGKRYYAFAAPTDLTKGSGKKLVLMFNNAAKEVGKLRNWHGHDGALLENDTALYDALRKGTYRGQWFVPDRPLLHGKDVDGKAVAAPNLLANKDNGAFAGTYTLTGSGYGDYPFWYWSLTERRENQDGVWNVRLSDGHDDWSHKDNHHLSCRPVRLELVL